MNVQTQFKLRIGVCLNSPKYWPLWVNACTYIKRIMVFGCILRAINNTIYDSIVSLYLLIDYFAETFL